MQISFNLRLRYEEVLICVEKIKDIGGDGQIVAGGSVYTGTKEQINKLIDFMIEKGYDTGSMAFDETPQESKARRVKALQDEGVI